MVGPAEHRSTRDVLQTFGRGVITARGRQIVSIHKVGHVPELVVTGSIHRVVILAAARDLLETPAGEIQIGDDRPGVGVGD